MGRAIGIDLGTTYSAMAFMEGGQPQIIRNHEGDNTTPSVVLVKDGEASVGAAAKRQMALEPENTLFGTKRFMGLPYSDDAVRELAAKMPYEIMEVGEDRIGIKADGEVFRPEQVAAQILKKLKADAKAVVGEEITDAVITVPAYFGPTQNQATKAAGEIAGLNVLNIINEPTAAALAYGFSTGKAVEPQDGAGRQRIAVYDLGGGTFDCSILEMRRGVLQVIATSGDPFLGGEDFDLRLLEHVLGVFKSESGTDLSGDPWVLMQLKEACETAKRDLSNLGSTNVILPNAGLNVAIQRDEFENLITDMVDRTIGICQDAMERAKLVSSDLDEVLLIGGQTRTPYVAVAVEQFFGLKPTLRSNPDEAVALGAAIQAGGISGDIAKEDRVALLDVTAATIGTDLIGNRFDPIIPRNTAIPCESGEREYYTTQDNQPAVSVKVLQGEELKTSDNELLGEFVLRDIKRAPKGQPIKMRLEIDVNGIIYAEAWDPQTGARNDATISGALTESQIAEMSKRADDLSSTT